MWREANMKLKSFCASAAFVLTTIMLMVAAATTVATAQTLTTLLSFDVTDGAYPMAGLTQGADGNLYGTSDEGGANAAGTVFKITPSGTLTTLYSFCSQSGCTDGSNPMAGLIEFLRDNQQWRDHARLKLVWHGLPNHTKWHANHAAQLRRNGRQHPHAGLVQATDGNFYGTTTYTTAFMITPTGTLTTYSLGTWLVPYAGLVQDTDGAFYGTTREGGTYTSYPYDVGAGTVYSL
jgi:uncharacterized repeat protein (TIGR03803 family)